MNTKNLCPPKAKFYGWDGYFLKANDIEMGVAPSIGGRIISLKYQGEELFFVNKDHLGETFDFSHVTDLEQEKLRLGHRLWGGDKTWVAPESSWLADLPPLDLDASQYSVKLKPHTVIMTSPVDRETGLCIIRQVELQPNGIIVLDQTFVNKTDKIIQFGIWDVTQLLRPFDIYFPVSETMIKPDLRFSAGTKHRKKLVRQENGWSKIICDQPWLFKYGSMLEQGVVVALRRNAKRRKKTLAMARFFDVESRAKYPHDNIAEVYNASEFPYLEVEILAPLKSLKPGKKTSHRQVWFLREFYGNVTPDKVVTEAVRCL